MPFRRNKLAVAVILGVAIAIFLGVMAWFSVFQLWELKLANFLYQTREPSKDIVIVGIDERTEKALGDSSRWSRSNYAQTLNNILAQKPAVVAFDLFFDMPRDAKGDQAFADALAGTDTPIILGFSARYNTDDFQSRNLPSTSTDFILPSLTASGNVTPALLHLLPDKDEFIRKVPSFFSVTGTDQTFDSLSFLAVKNFLGNDLQNVLLHQGALLVNYAVSSDQRRFFSFVDVYENTFPASAFSNKIVLIGPRSWIVGDKYFTPLSTAVQMPGIEIHANAIQTILDGAYLRYFTPLEKIALITFLALLSAFLFMFTRIRWSLLFLVAVGALYTWGAFPLFRAGIIADMVHPYLTVAMMFVAVYLYRYLTEFREKSALKSAFGKYVNPTVAEKIAAETPESLKLGGAKRDITVLFTDIAHFTSISEQLTPESLVALLNEYLEAMSQVIMAEGGTVDKFEGDAIMAFFGAPLDQPDHALRACRTALAMQRRLTELHQKWSGVGAERGGTGSEGEREQAHSASPRVWRQRESAAAPEILPGGEKKPLFNFRCGLSSGEAIIGNIGSSERLEYTAMGDIVNLGSRLEGANKKYSTSTMMSEDTYRRVADSVFARELDILRVVGKKQPVKVFELLGMKDDDTKEGNVLLGLYGQGIALYHARKFAEALAKFDEILVQYPDDGPSKLYRQRCEVLRDFPPPADWDGVFEMKSK